jgi:hypothetical protein
MIEPVYIAQTAECCTAEDRLKWLRARADDGRRGGAVFFRASIHPEMGLMLIEGWDTQSPGEQGAPRWQIAA